MKIFRPLTVLVFFLICPSFLHCGEPPNNSDSADPLDRMVEAHYSYRNFQEAIQQIELKSGFKTTLPKDTDGIIQMPLLGMGIGAPGGGHKESLRAFLDHICNPLSLKWKYDQPTNTLALDLDWRTPDPQSCGKLLKTLQDPKQRTPYENNPVWQHTFNALLSSPDNFKKGWKTRQSAELQFPCSIPYKKIKPLLIKEINSVSNKKYTTVLIYHPSLFSVTNGALSYYWFTKDGKLAGSGLFNTGHRCDLIDATIDNEFGSRSDKPTEFHLILKMNGRDFFIARLALEDRGMKLLSLADARGESVDNSGLGVGWPLLENP